MMVDVLPFKKHHLDLFSWRENEAPMKEVVEYLSGDLAENGYIFTGVNDGRILVIGGIIPISHKVGHCFTLFSSYSDLQPLASARAAKRLMTSLLETFGFHRLVTYNKPQNANHNKWCEWLGFERECLVRKLDDEGNDFYQYGLVR